MRDAGKSNGTSSDELETPRRAAIRSMRSLMNVLLEGRDSAGHFCVIEYRARQGSEPPPHVHSHENEFFYVLEGQLVFFVDHESISAGPGDSVFLSKGKPHAFRIESPAARALVVIEPAGLEGFFRSLGEPADRSAEEAAVAEADVASFAEIYGLRFLSEAEIAEQLPLLPARTPRDRPSAR